MREEWQGFEGGSWAVEVNVRSFIQHNYTPYEGDEKFLAGPTERTLKLWEKAKELMQEENKKGIIDAETQKPSTITAFGPGYLDKDNEVIVGFQTDKPLKEVLCQTVVSVWLKRHWNPMAIPLIKPQRRYIPITERLTMTEFLMRIQMP